MSHFTEEFIVLMKQENLNENAIFRYTDISVVFIFVRLDLLKVKSFLGMSLDPKTQEPMPSWIRIRQSRNRSEKRMLLTPKIGSFFPRFPKKILFNRKKNMYPIFNEPTNIETTKISTILMTLFLWGPLPSGFSPICVRTFCIDLELKSKENQPMFIFRL